MKVVEDNVERMMVRWLFSLANGGEFAVVRGCYVEARGMYGLR